ncbi:MAG: LLM class F420-dependent oxidoreductase [Acidimicrobiales bacterium]
MGQPSLGVMPVFLQGYITDAAYSRAMVQMLEAEGVESVWTVEHVVMAEHPEPRYPYAEGGRTAHPADTVLPDPLEWLAFAAACTERIHLGTAVMVLPLHQPAIVAKRVATVDNLSGGRLLLGVGSGWQIEEYRACAVPYERRGARLDDAIAALRELWQPGYRTHHGPYFQFDRCESKPTPLRAGGPPIIIGGSTEAAARRAGRLGDGYFPYVISPDDFTARVETVRSTASTAGRTSDEVSITVWPSSWQRGCSLDLEVMRRFADSGVDRVIVGAQECGSTEISVIRDFVRRVQDEILAKL